MSFISEFKEFAMKGNVVDTAVGIVIGVASGKVVGSFVNDILMPPIGYMMGGVNFNDLVYVLGAVKDGAEGVAIRYGAFIQSILDFLIIAMAVFVAVKVMNAMQKSDEEDDAPSQEDLLGEIRDLLKK